jgi:FixJ family two-component response regulator
LRTCGYDVIEYRSAQQFLNSPPEMRSGCILLDVRMPDVTGLQLQKRLAEMGSILPIVFLSGHGDIPISVEAMKAGAEDFLSKPVSKKALVDAVARALDRYATMHEGELRQKELRALESGLTPRERQVFLLVIKGKQNKQIAHELGATERTIKAHRQKVMSKLRVRSVVELTRIGERLGFGHPT